MQEFLILPLYSNRDCVTSSITLTEPPLLGIEILLVHYLLAPKAVWEGRKVMAVAKGAQKLRCCV